MKVLLDTHIILWAISDDIRLSNKARELILYKTNAVFYSTVSVWETTIKHMIKPDQIYINAEELVSYCSEMGYRNIPILNRHIKPLETLVFSPDKQIEHNDPFDRLLIAQAKSEEIYLITSDTKIPYYHEKYVIPV